MSNIPKLNTHKGFILYQLLRGKHLTNKGLSYILDTCFSGSRICELRKHWDISDKCINPDTKEKAYFIKRDKIFEYLKTPEVQEFIFRFEKLSIANTSKQ